jgi:hypothetical protein
VDGCSDAATGLDVVAVPEGVFDLPPGARLAAALDALDLSRLHGWQLVDVVAARYRQVAYEQAKLLAAVRELALSARGGW